MNKNLICKKTLSGKHSFFIPKYYVLGDWKEGLPRCRWCNMIDDTKKIPSQTKGEE